MTIIHNEAAYEAAIKAKIKENAATTRERKWFANDDRAKEIWDFVRHNAHNNDFLGKMWDSIMEWGALTENQRNAVVRTMDAQAERKAKMQAENAKSSYVGEIGDRMSFDCEVIFRVAKPNPYGYSSNDGACIIHHQEFTYIVGMKQGDDMIIYFGSGKLGHAKKGDTVKFDAKIKKHDMRDGVRQTIIQRPTKIQL